MSFILKTPMTSVPRICDLVEKLGLAEFDENSSPVLVCPEWEPKDRAFDDGLICNFSSTYESTRGIEVSREGDSLCVRVLSLSSPFEFDLALRFIEVARDFGAKCVYSNISDDEPTGFDFLRKKFSREYFDEWSFSSLRRLMVMTEADGGTVFELVGPNDSFFFGPNMASILGSLHDEYERLNVLHMLMRTKQYFYLGEEFEGCEVLPIKTLDDGTVCCEIEPDVSCVVPRVDELHFKFGTLSARISPSDFFDRIGWDLSTDKYLLLDEYVFRMRFNGRDIAAIINLINGQEGVVSLNF